LTACSADIPEDWPQAKQPYHASVGTRHPRQGPSPKSRAELALAEVCSKLGYCLPSDDQDEIPADPPPDSEAFVDAVLIAEGRH